MPNDSVVFPSQVASQWPILLHKLNDRIALVIFLFLWTVVRLHGRYYSFGRLFGPVKTEVWICCTFRSDVSELSLLQGYGRLALEDLFVFVLSFASRTLQSNACRLCVIGMLTDRWVVKWPLPLGHGGAWMGLSVQLFQVLIPWTFLLGKAR